MSTPAGPLMRAKFQIISIDDHGAAGQQIHLAAVGGSKVQADGYPADGSDEDNTYARLTPSGALQLSILNPNLMDKFKKGQKFYLDFTLAPAE